jgi:hypothetical protein
MDESTDLFGQEEDLEAGVELQTRMKSGNKGEHKFSPLDSSTLEASTLKDEEVTLYRYSRSTKRPIHYGNYLPIWKNPQGEPKILIGPDCKKTPYKF